MDTQQKIEQRRQEARERQKQLQKRANSKIDPKVKKGVVTALITIACVAVLFALIFPNTGLSRRIVTAATIGDERISAAEFSYYYRNAYTNYYQMMSQYVGADNIPIDTSKSLKKQQMSTEMTYADYFSNSALSTLTQLVALSSEAEKAGFLLSPEGELQIKSTVDSVTSSAEANGMSVNQYLARLFGNGFNLNLFKKCARRELLASQWQEFKSNEPAETYTSEQLEAYYNEHKQEYDHVDFRMVSFREAAATDTKEAVSVEEAKAMAEEFIEKAVDGETFAQLAVEKAAKDNDVEPDTISDSSFAHNVSYSDAQSIDTNLVEWLFSPDRTKGETAVVEAAGGTTFYAIMMEQPASRQDHYTVDVRHILVYAPKATSDEEAIQAASDTADDLLQQFLDGGMTEDKFAELANQYSYDTGSNTNGGLYTNVYPGDMVTEFDEWCFDPSRQSGDFGIVQTEFGFHCMYFVGTGDPKWETDVKAAMLEEDYTEYYAGIAENYPVKTHWLGMMFRSEPI